MKNTLRNGRVSLVLWGTEMKINVFTDTVACLNLELTERYGHPRKMKRLEK